jgi:hypothetical protein
LLQAVLEANLGVAPDQILDLVKVNDDVIALSHAQSDAGDLYRRRKEIVVCNYPERNHRASAQGIGEEELVVPRWPSIQNAESVASLVHTQERFEGPIGQLDIAEQAFEVEGIETDLSQSNGPATYQSRL